MKKHELIEFEGKQYKIVAVDGKPTLQKVEDEPNSYDKAIDYLKGKGLCNYYDHSYNNIDSNSKWKKLNAVLAYGRLLVICEAMHHYHDVDNRYSKNVHFLHNDNYGLRAYNQHATKYSALRFANSEIADSILSVPENEELVKIYLGV